MGERWVHGDSAAHSTVFDAKDGSAGYPFRQPHAGMPVRRPGVGSYNSPKIIPKPDEQILCAPNTQVHFGFGNELGRSPVPYRNLVRFFMGKGREDSLP